MRHFLPSLIVLSLFIYGCSEDQQHAATPPQDTPSPAQKPVMEEESDISKLDNIIASRPESERARVAARHPKETIAFFKIKPGMTVAEVLPGKGWYSSILVPFLGEEGKLVGIDYDIDIWEGNFYFANDAFIAERSQWADTWPDTIASASLPGAKLEAFTFSTIPETVTESVDRVLFVRAMHHLIRTQDKGDFLKQAMADTMRILKPGGLVGVVQHQSPEGADDKWADGNAGYLKKSTVISAFEDAGFILLEESSINENPNDQPEGNIVWRLPPTYAGSDTDEQKAAMDKIGESTRMTLLFKKPE